jgi:glycosyltransferase involved in cell wall biosynthesis
MDLVIAGNRHLAAAVPAGSTRVEIVPTPIDCERYQQSAPDRARTLRLLWIGLPENLIYLEPLRPVIANLQRSWPELKLRVVCSRFPEWDDSMLECVPWSSEGEVRAIAGADVGLMPLSDNEWTRGKCAFKLLQYMAAGLPCVASPVGANSEVVTHDYNGYLATTEAQWYESLHRLLASSDLRTNFGARGLARVRSHYDIPQIASRTAALIAGLARAPDIALPADARHSS